jgi:hypothetical protein
MPGWECSFINMHHHVPDSPTFPAGPDTAMDGMDPAPYGRLWMGTCLGDATLSQEAMATVLRGGLGRVQSTCRNTGAEVTCMAGQLMLQLWDQIYNGSDECD